MSKETYFAPDFIRPLVPRIGDDENYTTLAGYDVPRGTDVGVGAGGEFVYRFVYSDREPLGEEVPVTLPNGLSVRVAAGKHSGKLMVLKAPADLSPVELGEQIAAVAGRQKKMNQRMNFTLISRILGHMGRELIPA